MPWYIPHSITKGHTCVGNHPSFLPNYVEQSCYLGRDQSQTRIKNEVGTVKHVEALQFFFLLAQISSIVFPNVKTWLIPRTVVCVLLLLLLLVVVVVGGGGGQDVIIIQTSTMIPLSATVSRVSTGVGGWGSGYKCICVLVYACAK